MKSTGLDSTSSGHCSLLAVDHKNFKTLWNDEVYQNRERWKAQAAKGIPRPHPPLLSDVGSIARMGSDPFLVQQDGLRPNPSSERTGSDPILVRQADLQGDPSLLSVSSYQRVPLKPW